jgi:hypothetical protein
MSTQAIAAALNGSVSGKEAVDTSTDGKWDGNNLLETISSAQVGLALNGASVNAITVQYTGGGCLWRLQDMNTLQIFRQGFGSKTGTVDPSGYSIAPITINNNMILQAYPVAVNATANDSEVLALIHMTKGIEAFSCTTSEDATLTSMTSIISGEEIGTYFGQLLTGFEIQAEDGATVNKCSIINADGGVAWTGFGTVRDAGNYYVNMAETGLSIPIVKGMKIQVAVTTA